MTFEEWYEKENDESVEVYLLMGYQGRMSRKEEIDELKEAWQAGYEQGKSDLLTELRVYIDKK